MKRRNGLTLAAAVLLLSASALASSIADPGGIIRKGDNYDKFAIIGEGFSISFDGEPLPFPFNPFSFTDTFCPVNSVIIGDQTFTGPDCQFLNESGQTIDSVTQIFSADAAAFEGAGGISCFNDITGVVCPTPNGNSLLFSGLGIPSAREYSDGGYGTEGGDPFFNIINFGFDNNHSLAQIAGITIPEPASLGLMLSGLFGLGLAWKRRDRAKSR
ncbi:MAG TPA: PEP-CTERM sorting domain-containing protein [Terriglobales bacterium]|nr:PEP-CTERM sorting domain-containing protein [Terriglobales bacterium]